MNNFEDDPVGSHNVEGSPLDATGNGETVDATEKNGSGEVVTKNWTDAIDKDRDELNEDQIKVIEAARDHVAKLKSVQDIRNFADLNHRSRQYPNNVLSTYWPERKEKIKKEHSESDTEQSEPNENGWGNPKKYDPQRHYLSPKLLDEIRIRRANGESAEKLADELGVKKTRLRPWLRGDKCKFVEYGTTVPPLDEERNFPDWFDLSESEYKRTESETKQPEDNYQRPSPANTEKSRLKVTLLALGAIAVLWRWLRR